MAGDHWRVWFGGLHRAWVQQSELSSEARLDQARAFIDEHFAELDLGTIAERAHLSRYHFLRLFRERYGITPHQYVIERRLERARDLLEHTEKSVIDICLDVGFQSPSSFSSLFRRRVGHSPSRFRRRWVQSNWRAAPIPWCFRRHLSK